MAAEPLALRGGRIGVCVQLERTGCGNNGWLYGEERAREQIEQVRGKWDRVI